MLLQLGGQVGVDVFHGVNGLVGDALLSSEDHLPEVLDAHQLQAVCEEGPPPRSQFVFIHVHMTKEAVEAAETVVSECLWIEFHHILNEDVLD